MNLLVDLLVHLLSNGLIDLLLLIGVKHQESGLCWCVRLLGLLMTLALVMKVLLLGMALRSVVMFLLYYDGVSNKTFPESQEKVVELTALFLYLFISLLLLMDMSTVFLMILSGILGLVHGNVLCEVMGDVRLVLLGNILGVVYGAVLLMKLSTVDLVLLRDIHGVVLGKILFNGNCLGKIYRFCHIFLQCCILSLVQMCGNILGCVDSDILLSKSFLGFWYSLGLEKVFGSNDSLIVLLLDFDALFDYIRDLLLLSFWFYCLFSSHDERLGSTEIKLVRVFGWLKWLFVSDNLLVTRDLLGCEIFKSSLALSMTLIVVINLSILS